MKKRSLVFILLLSACICLFTQTAVARPKHSAAVYNKVFSDKIACDYEHTWIHTGMCGDGIIRTSPAAPEIDFYPGGKVYFHIRANGSAEETFNDAGLGPGRVYVSKNQIFFHMQHGEHLFVKNNKTYYYRTSSKHLKFYRTKSDYLHRKPCRVVDFGVWS